MPVRFRCRHCHQLLGISRRKIGMAVSCPTCHIKVVVPATDAPDVDRPAAHKPDPLFEGSDLDALLQPALVDPAPGSAQVPINVEPYSPPVLPPMGVMLSPFQAILLTVGTAFLLAVVFAAGLLIGRFWF
jgi:phage FluMu protein Com